MSASPLHFRGDNRPRYRQGQAPPQNSLGKGDQASARAQAMANRLANQRSHSGSTPTGEVHRAISLRPSPSGTTTTKGGRVPTPDSGPRPRVRQARIPGTSGDSGAGPPPQTPLTPHLPLPPSQNPMIPQRTSASLTWWTPLVFPVDLPLKDIYCLRDEIPVAGHLTYFLPFWEEVIQADRWVLEIIHHGYSIELIRPPQLLGFRHTPNPLEGQ